MQNIRNFCIIAHIDHGKSTLADRMLEVTKTIEARKMKDQVLDNMELERERGITIKMQPVRMVWSTEVFGKKEEYILNLIDTPGHIDFSYEVSRALNAVEGVVLLIDATQGVQAQTLTVLEMAKANNLKIIPAISKIDSQYSMVEEVKDEICNILSCKKEDIIETSGKTGEGVSKLLDTIIKEVPPPKGDPNLPLQALVFDFKYSPHKGIVVFVRVVNGTLNYRDHIIFRAGGQDCLALDVGIFHPEEVSTQVIKSGEIGYIMTGIKDAGIVSVGDTIGKVKESGDALPGFGTPKPVVWASIFPEDQGDLVLLRQSLLKLKLTDSSLYFEEESSGVLGKGFRCGFLGMLHLEIISERLIFLL